MADIFYNAEPIDDAVFVLATESLKEGILYFYLGTLYYNKYHNAEIVAPNFAEVVLPTQFIFTGYVQVQSLPAARTVYLYHRSTGDLVGSAVSNALTGYFEIPTAFSDYHFVNILPELSEDYNILVEDKIEQGS